MGKPKSASGNAPSTPLVDLTSIHGVESLFSRGPRDPFAGRLAADLADLFIFSDRLRYAVTRPAEAPESEWFGAVPQLVEDLARRDPGVLSEASLVIGPQTVNPDHLRSSFESFSAYALNNRKAVSAFMRLHNSPGIRVRPPYREGVNTGWVFPLEKLAGQPELGTLSARLRLHPEDLCHLFDMVLKYSLYGRLAGEGTYYLAHPFRAEQNFPTQRKEPAEPPPLPFRCGRAFASLRSLSRDEYTALLHEARGLVREMKLIHLRPGAMEKEALREFASRLRLPARLKDAGRVWGLVGGLVGTAGALPLLGAPAAVAGGLISIATSFWTAPLPRAVSRWTWLHWALDWDLEDEGR